MGCLDGLNKARPVSASGDRSVSFDNAERCMSVHQEPGRLFSVYNRGMQKAEYSFCYGEGTGLNPGWESLAGSNASK